MIDYYIEALKNLDSYITKEDVVKFTKPILYPHRDIIITGIGKAGQIGARFSSTLTSIGYRSIFVDPVACFHGDFGLFDKSDVVILLSNSGNTSELIDFVNNIDLDILSITGNKNSYIAKRSSAILTWPAIREIDALNLVPTTSILMMNTLCDLVINHLLTSRELLPELYKKHHPKGAIGKKLHITVNDLVRDNPFIMIDQTVQEALSSITKSGLGATAVLDGKNIVGIITDGDIRRLIESKDGNIDLKAKAASIMTHNPQTVEGTVLAIDAIKLMESHKPRPISILPVINNHKLTGMVHLHTLLQGT